MEFPIVIILVARRATQRSGLRFVMARERAHEFRHSVDDLVPIHVQLKRILLVLRDLIEHMVSMAGRTGNGALRVPLPGTENRLVGGKGSRRRQQNENGDEKWAGHSD